MPRRRPHVNVNGVGAILERQLRRDFILPAPARNCREREHFREALDAHRTGGSAVARVPLTRSGIVGSSVTVPIGAYILHAATRPEPRHDGRRLAVENEASALVEHAVGGEQIDRSACDPTVVPPRQNDDLVLAVTCRTEPSTDRDAVVGSRSLWLDAQTTLEPMIQVRPVDSLDHLDRLHGCVPFSVLSAVDGRMADVFRVDAPVLAVGLDATR